MSGPRKPPTWLLTVFATALVGVLAWSILTLLGRPAAFLPYERLRRERFVPLVGVHTATQAILDGGITALSASVRRSAMFASVVDSAMRSNRSLSQVERVSWPLLADSFANAVAGDSVRIAAQSAAARSVDASRAALAFEVALGRERSWWTLLAAHLRKRPSTMTREELVAEVDGGRAYAVSLDGAVEATRVALAENSARRDQERDLSNELSAEVAAARLRLLAAAGGLILSIEGLMMLWRYARTGRAFASMSKPTK